MMYGAMFGDIIGSRFEFDRGGKTKDFALFTEEDSFTDDTVMTVAVAEGLLNAGKDADAERIREEVTRSMRKWGKAYPNAGYGGRFWNWLFSGRKPQPYGSWGNGSAMRVSAAGWLYDTLDRTLEAARATAEVTHNHPEGIKGAECTAAVIFLARTGRTKEEIRSYAEQTFGYDLSRTVDELRPLHRHVESCQDSLPKALVSFLEGSSYEDAVRNAVSLGGDTDTIGAIAGSMAEAFYGIPVTIFAKGAEFLPEDLLAVAKRFDAAIGRGSKKKSTYDENLTLKEAAEAFRAEATEDNLLRILFHLLEWTKSGAEPGMPMVDADHVLSGINTDTLTIGDIIHIEKPLRLRMDTLQSPDGKIWYPLYTDSDELSRAPSTGVSLNVPVRRILSAALHDEAAEGVVLNPFGKSVTLPKNILGMILDAAGPADENAEPEGEAQITH